MLQGDLSGASFFKVLAAKTVCGWSRIFKPPLFRRGEMCYNINDFHILGLN